MDGLNRKDESGCLEGKGSCPTLDYILNGLPGCTNTSIVISIQSGFYNYSLNASNTEHQMWNCLSIIIAGIDSESTIVNCRCWFCLLYAWNVVVHDISFVNCGSRQNSTSYNPITKSTSMANVGLYFAFCQNVEFNECKVTNSHTTGVLMYNTYGNLNVVNSHFISNRIASNSAGGGGGFYAEFCYCDPGTTDNCVQRLNSLAYYRFQNSTFFYNVPSDGLEQNNRFIIANGATNIAFEREDGLSLILRVTPVITTFSLIKIVPLQITMQVGEQVCS